MIGTELIKGQGLGNQLFCYVTARAIAADRGVPFGLVNPSQLGHVAHSDLGVYFMDIDTGIEIPSSDISHFNIINERDDRLYTGTSEHDLTHGCFVSGADERVLNAPDNSLLYGNLQSEEYFIRHIDEIREWLRVKPEYDSREYTADDLCIINLRGGEYMSEPNLAPSRRYFLHAISNMKQINPDMRFMVVTEDEEAARKVLPEYERHHFDVCKDYVTVKNARYLILSNSSFAVFPAMTSTELRYAIAPKYWARHNVSDGYWASEQNIYSFLHYQDRRGRIWEPDECKLQLDTYKQKSVTYKRVGQKPSPVSAAFKRVRADIYKGLYYGRRMYMSALRRIGLIRTWMPGGGCDIS